MWNNLADAMRRLPPSGSQGFEGLAAELLTELLGERFTVAKAGTQTSGDARSLSGGVSVQAKRYLAKTPIQETEIEGDFRRVARSMLTFEVYVLVVTRDTAQLQTLVDILIDDTALDIVVLDCGDEHSSMIALATKYYDRVTSKFTRDLAREDEQWARRHGGTDAVDKRVGSLRSEILGRFVSYKSAAKKGTAFLRTRFDETQSKQRLGSTIRLAKSIQRGSLLDQFESWWNDELAAVAYIEGEEGLGKSWGAAQFVRSLDAGILRLWLDSSDWASCTTLTDVIRTAFRRAGYEDRLADRLAQRAVNRWGAPVLLVLDGANEGAIPATERILRNYFDEPRRGCRLLFTTRPLDQRPQYRAGLWNNCRKIEARPFSETELAAALASLEPALTPEDLSPSLASVARIPRYFRACAQVRERLGSIDRVTKELVLWEVLIDRIEGTDAQIRERIGWTSKADAATALALLAQRAPDGTTTPEAVNGCFDHSYTEIRRDLVELRITRSAERARVEVSPDHLVLAWALLLNAQLGERQHSVSEFADLVKELLEPSPGDDVRTAALYVALHLSPGSTSRQYRAALLHTWATATNSEATDVHLSYWAVADCVAYTMFVEQLFLDLTGSDERVAVEPLAKLWQQGGPWCSELAPVLKRWMLLTWPSDRADEIAGLRLEVPASHHQLRLASVALSILSQRPTPEFLLPLAVTSATAARSYEETDSRKHYLKYLHEEFKTLLRWGYTETVVPRLAGLFEETECEVVRAGLKQLAAWLAVPLPDALNLDGAARSWSATLDTLSLLRQSRPFLAEYDERRTPFNLRFFAVRTDLPDLHADDVAILKQRVWSLISSLEGGPSEFPPDELRELWPWFARSAPDQVASSMTRLETIALAGTAPRLPLTLFYGIPPPTTCAQELLPRILAVAQEITDGAQVRESTIVLFAHAVSLSSDDDLVDWLDLCARHLELRHSAFVYPNPLLLESRLRQPDVMHSQKRAMCAAEESDSPSEFEYWCYLASFHDAPDRDTFLWAKEWLLAHGSAGTTCYWVALTMARAGPDGWLEEILADDELLRSLTPQALRGIWRLRPQGFRASDSAPYEHWLEHLPVDVAAYLYIEANRHEDFDRWGDELMQLACELVGAPPFEPTFRGSTIFGLNNEGCVTIKSYTRKVDARAMRGGGSWGIELAEPQDLLNALTPDEDAADADLDTWRSDQERLSGWEHFDIHSLEDSWLLRRWASRNLARFKELAHAFLDALPRSRRTASHLGLFTDTVLRVLLEYEPRYSLRTHSRLKDRMRTRVVTPDGASAIEVDLFGDRCASQEHRLLQMDVFENASNDLEIRLIAAGTQSTGNEALLGELALTLMNDTLARQRALGVSIAAWMREQTAFEILTGLRESDPSAWIRTHAKWACEVWAQQHSAQELYREALAADVETACALLHRIAPALVVGDRWWMAASDKSEGVHPELQGTFASFGYRFANGQHNRKDAIDRKLDQYCRGHRLHQSTLRMAPFCRMAAGP